MTQKSTNEPKRRIGRPPLGEPRRLRTTIMLSDTVREALEQIANENDRSLSAEINLRLRRSLKEEIL